MEAGRGFLWWPVGAASGSAGYFALPFEPPMVFVAVLTATAVLAVLGMAARGRPVRVAVAVAAFAVLGLLAAKISVQRSSAPVITYGRTLAITGMVERVEDRGPRGVRVLIAVRDLDPRLREGLPVRARVTINKGGAPAPGEGIRVLARVGPPQPPLYPGGYDFARTAYFEQVGMIGFSLGAAERIELSEKPSGLAAVSPAIERIRLDVSARIREAIEGNAGAIAAALVVGDRGAISPEAAEAMRISGLSHVLAISGLHMGIVAACLFGGLRAMLALVPRAVLYWPVKTIAAVFALSGAAAYLVIAGMSLPTQRSFVMIAVALVAVMIGRRPFSLRSVAVAALVVVAIHPVAVLDPGAQMSFSAVVALVAGYEALAARRGPPPDRGDISPLVRALGTAGKWLAGALVTSLIAGLATTPVGLYHFHRAAPLGLLANLAAAPLIAFVIMPAGVVSALALPFGLEGMPLLVMGAGIEGMLGIATTVADWTPGGGTYGRPALSGTLAVMLGLIWVCLWTGAMRWPGVALIAVGLILAPLEPMPQMIVSGSGKRAMIIGQDGQPAMLGSLRTFEAGIWLTAIGATVGPDDESLMTYRTVCDQSACLLLPDPPPARGGLIPPRIPAALVRHPAAFADECPAADLVVTPLRAPDWCRDMTTVLDRTDLAGTGARTFRFMQQDESLDATDANAAGPPAPISPAPVAQGHDDRRSGEPTGMPSGSLGTTPRLRLVPLENALPVVKRPWHSVFDRDRPVGD